MQNRKKLRTDAAGDILTKFKKENVFERSLCNGAWEIYYSGSLRPALCATRTYAIGNISDAREYFWSCDIDTLTVLIFCAY